MTSVKAGAFKAFYGNELPLYEKNNLSIISNDYK